VSITSINFSISYANRYYLLSVSVQKGVKFVCFMTIEVMRVGDSNDGIRIVIFLQRS